jgi:hypothetical protein
MRNVVASAVSDGFHCLSHFRTCYVANSETGEAFVKIKDHSHEIGVTILNLEHPDGVITLSGENNAVTCDHRMKDPV